MNVRRSLEEALAQQAAARIRKRLRGKKRGGKTGFLPRLAIKFCGGCNPTIERGIVAERIRERLAGAVTWVSIDEEKDFLVMIQGCPTACAELPDGGKTPSIVICGEAGFPESVP